jgi:hypothetical protein
VVRCCIRTDYDCIPGGGRLASFGRSLAIYAFFYALFNMLLFLRASLPTTSNHFQLYDSPVIQAAPLAYVRIVYVASLQTVRGAVTDPTRDGGLA